MRIPRLLFRRFLVWLSVLIAWLLFLLWGAPAVAQTNRSPQAAPPAAALRQAQAATANAADALRHSRNLAIGSERCYPVREYRIQRNNPNSDATRFKDYLACEPANQFHIRAAVSPPVRAVPVPNARPNPALQHCGFAYGNVCPAMVPAGPPITR
jgi:hypothetical protein